MLRLWSVTIALALSGLLIPTTSPAQASEQVAAYYAPTHRQVVTVRVDSATATFGRLETWRWSAKKESYVRVHKPVRAHVGSAGVGEASEYVSRTPAGMFTLTETFGRQSNIGIRLPYQRVGYSSWWVSDVSSRFYNTYRTCNPGSSCGFDQSRSEQLGAISLYQYAAVIDYNRDPIRSRAGSAFFLHVSAGEPTQGCVSIREAKLKRVLRWLSPHAVPVISIGVGNEAYRPIR